jgi:hypothetical protein
MSWKGYAYRLRAIVTSIEECRRELEELRSSILVSYKLEGDPELTSQIQLALECARQQRYREDIDRRTVTLDSAFPGGM